MPEPIQGEDDGLLGEWTEADLRTAGNSPHLLAEQVGTALGAAAVANARTQTGVTESPMGSNCGVPHQRYVLWIAPAGTPCVPWCAYFVGWAFDTSSKGNRDHRAPWGTSGYVPWIYNWARSHGKLVSTPAHGDVFFLNPTDPNRSHMGLVAGADPGHGTIYTCEGNWSDRVLNQTRNYHAGNYAFARI
ncbi:MAG: CHAP domain-containing protein [Jatrophihabitantaceae bacterium]